MALLGVRLRLDWRQGVQVLLQLVLGKGQDVVWREVFVLKANVAQDVVLAAIVENLRINGQRPRDQQRQSQMHLTA